MNISIATVFPELYTSFLSTSLLGRAQENKLISVDLVSFFSLVKPKERIDAPIFGHGAGMLIKPEVVQKAVEQQEAKHGKAFKIFFSPQGKKLNQSLMAEIAQKSRACNHLMLVASRYEGMDARVEEAYADEIVSLGDFVIMGGDLPAQVLLEGVARLWPQVVGKQESIETESFSGPFVDFPAYTEPVEWQGNRVPEVIRSGNHKAVDQWRQEQAAQKTVVGHFAWLRSYPLLKEQKKLAARYIPHHYVVLMHDEIMLPGNKEGTTSITSLDIHDIARSARTYGLKRYFLVTPLQDQQKIGQKLLDFWRADVGIAYNPHRHEALEHVEILKSLDEVVNAIERIEGKKPLIIATSAKKGENNMISYNQQGVIWKQQRPVLLVLGTGRGLAPAVIKRSDYLLVPIEGFTDFNHLSVRSAAAIIFDRWLGLNPG